MPIIDSNKSIIEFSNENVCEDTNQTVLDSKSNSSESNKVINEVSTQTVIEEEEYEEDDVNNDNGRNYDSPGLGYGKLWIFIRDLLQNDRYNPRIIK